MKRLYKFKTLALFTLMILCNNNYAQNYWEKTNWPSGVLATTIKLITNSNGDIFVGTDNGVYRSSDNGNNWIQLNNGLTLDAPGGLNIYTLAIDSNENIFVAIYNELYRSTDNGNHWVKIKSGLTVSALAFNSSGHIFIAGGSNEVYRSSDNGINWVQINNGLNSNSVYSFAINSSGHIFAGTFDGVYCSTDNGDNWTPKLNFGDRASSLVVNSSGHIFVQMSTNVQLDQKTDGVYRSTNNGDNWTQIIQYNGVKIKNFSGADVIMITSNGYIYLGTNDGVYRSIDNGDNWTILSNGLNSNNLRVYALVSNLNGNIFAGTWDGVYRLK